jgi:hypothetical protein
MLKTAVKFNECQYKKDKTHICEYAKLEECDYCLDVYCHLHDAISFHIDYQNKIFKQCLFCKYKDDKDDNKTYFSVFVIPNIRTKK